MTRVSSNTTIFWKLFVPIFYTTVFGLLAIVMLTDIGANFSVFSSWYVKGSYLMMFLSVIGFMYFTIIQLKRVEFGTDHFIVTNYFKTYKYSIQDIETYKTYNFNLLKVHSIHLKSKGKFGKKIRFIPYLVGIEKSIEENSEWKNIIESANNSAKKK